MSTHPCTKRVILCVGHMSSLENAVSLVRTVLGGTVGGDKDIDLKHNKPQTSDNIYPSSEWNQDILISTESFWFLKVVAGILIHE